MWSLDWSPYPHHGESLKLHHLCSLSNNRLMVMVETRSKTIETLWLRDPICFKASPTLVLVYLFVKLSFITSMTLGYKFCTLINILSSRRRDWKHSGEIDIESSNNVLFIFMKLIWISYNSLNSILLSSIGGTSMKIFSVYIPFFLPVSFGS